MQSFKKQLLWLTIWGVAFALIEAAVVVYLRQIYFPEGFSFPPLPTDGQLIKIELLRELATIVIMWSVAELSRIQFTEKLAVFMILFGVWDIFYYLFLKLFIGWPASLATWDVLFLIPVVWVGPVWSPVLISICLISAGVIGLFCGWNKINFQPTVFIWVCELIAMVLVISSFIIPGIQTFQNQGPASYPWGLLIAGLVFGLSVFGYHLYSLRITHRTGSE
ncbi:MAG: hypothetical protein ACE5D2_06130 [Fidelibacterota bacterium]